MFHQFHKHHLLILNTIQINYSRIINNNNKENHLVLLLHIQDSLNHHNQQQQQQAPLNNKRLLEQQYRDDLKVQAQQKQQEKQKKKKEEEEYNRMMVIQMNEYNPWGKGGGGAPLRDEEGRVMAVLKGGKAGALEQTHYKEWEKENEYKKQKEKD
ncbi:MAG: hypothetical protein EZS28_054908 [Streblomastix strix]|uniref:Uncharacterized protein n=1 Tax=Streblomastix strix TaxID=222440 RepID=A0A5J4QCL4_9EUKA|nr:MAG: hypothetical protein EZS28_054908 [Streblomastix strix]